MSETVQQPGGAPAPAVTPTPAPEYRPSESLSSEPEAAPEQPSAPSAQPSEPAEEAPQETEADHWKREKRSLDQRLGYLSKQRYAERHRAEEAERQLSELRRQVGQQQEVPADWWQHPDVQKAIDARAAEKARVDGFLQAGAAEVPDWDRKRFELIEMGADPGIAEILVSMRNGHKVAGALYDHPDELQRIVELRTERERAVALGAFAASLDARRPPVVPSPATPRRAPSPPPPQPIAPPAATRHGEPDPGGSMDDYYKWSAKQNWRNR